MGSRLCRLCFSDYFLRNNGLDPQAMVEIMKELPVDSKVVNFGTDPMRGEIFITVEHEDFKEVSPCQEIPSVSVIVKQKMIGYDVEIDFDDVLEKKATSSTQTLTNKTLTIPNGIVYVGTPKMMYVDEPDGKHDDQVMVREYFGLPRDFDLPEDDDEVVDKCEHEWVNWVNSFSGRVDFEYCKSCGVKKDEA